MNEINANEVCMEKAVEKKTKIVELYMMYTNTYAIISGISHVILTVQHESMSMSINCNLNEGIERWMDREV